MLSPVDNVLLPFQVFQENIFSQFGRLNPAYEGIYQGVGLGLSIVKQFISDIKGEIHVDSQVGKGSIFTCIIPLKKAANSESKEKVTLDPKANRPQMLRPKKNKILVVEDHPIAQMAIKNLLEELNCEIEIAETGQKAISLYTNNQFNAVFMDIGLPDIDGFKVITKIRKLEKQKGQHTPIIVLTAHIDNNPNKQKPITDIDGFLTKPLTSEAALNILNNLDLGDKK